MSNKDGHSTYFRDQNSTREQAQMVARTEDRKVAAMDAEKLDLSEQPFNWDEATGKERLRVTKYSASQVVTTIIFVVVFALVAYGIYAAMVK